MGALSDLSLRVYFLTYLFLVVFFLVVVRDVLPVIFWPFELPKFLQSRLLLFQA